MTLRPPPPVATRLNRVALWGIVALVAVTAVVALHYVAASGRPMASAVPDSVTPVVVAQRPSFPSPAAPVRDTTRIETHATARVATSASPVRRREPQGPAAALIVGVDSAPSQYALTAGTVLAATLVTEITSDLPGTVVAQLTRDAYDSRSGQYLLIPRGTKLIGRYDSHLSIGQRRLLVTWTLLVFPDSRELALPDLAAIDEHGSAGLSDVTDNHLPRVFGTALLYSAIGAGAQLSQPSSGSALTTPSAGQVAAGALGQQMSGTALDAVRRAGDIPPTITARAGLAFDLVLARDLVLPSPYADRRR